MYRLVATKLRLTSKHTQLLEQLVIDEKQPGTILHDFNVILSVFREKQQTLTPAHQPPMALLTEINQRMKHPIQLALKRPQAKSYPNVQGLYLLLRTCGLSFVDMSGKKPLLVFDEDAFQQWGKLNPTERYCTLLETWFLRGYGDLLGERSRPVWSMPDNFDMIAHFLDRYDLKAGLQVAGDKNVENDLNYFPGRHQLALLNLFGFIDIQSGVPQPGEGWRIERITMTSVGIAFLSLLYNEFFSKHELVIDLDDQPSSGVFQNILKPYFPELQHNLIPAESTFQDGTYIFKVSLGKIWRRIAMDAKQSLDVLASVILESVDFDEDHLYEFSYRNRFGTLQKIYHNYMEEEPLLASEVRVGDLSLSIGQNMIFLFDFGDNWEFDLVLEAVKPDHLVQKVKILEAHGEAPEQYPYEDFDDFDEEFDEDEEP